MELYCPVYGTFYEDSPICAHSASRGGTNSHITGTVSRSRRPYRHASRLPVQIERLILQLNEKHSSRGAQKIRDKIIKT
jgi:hypothetical protein